MRIHKRIVNYFEENLKSFSNETMMEFLDYVLELIMSMLNDVVRDYLTVHGFYITDFITLGKYAVDYWRWDYLG